MHSRYMPGLKVFFGLTSFLVTPTVALAITVTPTSDASGLADTLFLNVGGLAIQSASFFGSAGQAGTYANPQGTYGLPNSGILLSSGNVSDYATGPNTEPGKTTDFGAAATADQQDLLFPITGQSTHFDVSQLDISFFAPDDVSNVSFFGAFGSEEWEEFVGSDFIDGFGLYVNGQNVAGVLPTGGSPGDPLLAVNIDHPDMRPVSGTELDGVLAPNGSPVLRFDVPVLSGQINDFQIILADASDGVLDTTVYLSSFFADTGGPGSGSGETEFDPVLPSNPPNPVTGAFEIEIPDVPPATVVWIDPPIAVGYEYTVTGNAFATVTAPSLATVADLDGYTIEVGAASFDLLPGQTLDLLALLGFGATEFTLTGIDPLLALDPADPLAFPLGLSFENSTGSSTVVTMTPTTIPIPGTLPLYLGGLVFAAATARRLRKS